MREQGIEIDYKFGTMIEIPRAALTAHQLAEHAEFFSFDTNDLTQTTFGMSRDVAEAGFLIKYMRRAFYRKTPLPPSTGMVSVSLWHFAFKKPDPLILNWNAGSVASTLVIPNQFHFAMRSV